MTIDKTTATLLWHSARRTRTNWPDALSHAEEALTAKQYEAARKLIEGNDSAAINAEVRRVIEGKPRRRAAATAAAVALALLAASPAIAKAPEGMLRRPTIDYTADAKLSERDGTYPGMTIGIRACPATAWARYGCMWRDLNGKRHRYGRRGDLTVLIPTHAPDGRPLSDAEAIRQWERTRRDFGWFADLKTATASVRR